ncbi:MAG: protein kinase [Planctomycetota bacterium]
MSDPQGETPPLFPSGVAPLARELLAPGTDPAATGPADAEATTRLAAGSASPTLPGAPRRLGPYVLLDELGHGGMGVVYRARHENLGTPCAVKVLIAGEHASLEAIVRFQREAASVARMGKHPNIVTVFDLGQEGGLAYYAMEYVEGVSLRRAMAERDLTSEETASLVEKVARALHFAHTHGIVHRDVKPENVVMRDGEPQVMDFGLAHEIGSNERLTLAGQVMGTLAYMAPEQARGDVAATDARTDVYSLGGVLYELLTGFPPHRGKTIAAVMPLILRGDIVAPRRLRAEVPKDLETICMKALSLDPARRYQTAEAFADDLARWTRREPILARRVGLPRRARLFVTRHKAASAAAAVVLAVFATLGAAWYATPGTLRLAVTPAGADVRIDGRPASAGDVRLAAGGHAVVISAPDHASESREVLIERRGTKELTVALRHDEGTLFAECPVPDAMIDIGKKSFGRRVPDQAIETGRHRLVAWAPGHFEKEAEVEVRRDARTSAYFWLDSGVLWTRDAPSTSSPAHIVPDTNGDGCPDLFEQELSRLVLYSGRDGAELWSMSEGISSDTWIAPLPILGPVGEVWRVSSSGSDDLLVLDLGKSGRVATLWRWHREGGGGTVSVRGCPEAIPDITDDGEPDVAYAASDGALFLLDGASGREVARTVLPTRVPKVLSIDGGRLFWFTASPQDRAVKVGSLRLKGLSIEWERDLDPDAGILPYPGQADEEVELAVILSSSRCGVLDARTGVDRWSVPVPVQGKPSLADIVESKGGEAVLPLLGKGGEMVVLDLRDGHVLWRVPSGVLWLHKPVHGWDLVLYRTDAGLEARGQRGGELRWGLAGSSIDTCPADLDGDGQEELIVSIEGTGLRCVDMAGRVRWTLRTEGNVRAKGVIPDVDGRGNPGIPVTSSRTMVGVLRPPRVLWERRAQEPLQATPLVLACDGRPCVVQLGRWAGLKDLACFDGATGDERWSSTEWGEPNRAPAVCDWDRDGRADIAWVFRPRSAGEHSAQGVAFLRGTDGAALATFKLEQPVGSLYAVPVAIDLNGDGVCDLACQEWDTQQVRAVDGRTGATLWRYAMAESSMGGMAAADLDMDGAPEVVAPSLDGFVHAIHGRDGTPLWDAKVGGSRSPPTLADLNGDGTTDVMLITVEGRLHALDGRTGATIWNDLQGAEAMGRPAVASVKGVGMVILAPLGSAGVEAFSWPGKDLIWRTPEGMGVTASPVVSDLDGDGKEEVVVGTIAGEMWVLDLATGARLWGWKLGDAVIEADPAVADLDGDGSKDILIASQARTLTAIGGHGTGAARARLGK